MKKIIITFLAFPFVALAQAPEPLPPLVQMIMTVRRIFDDMVPLLMVTAVALFLWGIVKYITAAGDEEKVKSARGYIVYGLISLFVMVAFWGVIQVVSSTFGIQIGGTINLPRVTP